MPKQYADAEMILNAEMKSEQYADAEMLAEQYINAEVVFKYRSEVM